MWSSNSSFHRCTMRGLSVILVLATFASAVTADSSRISSGNDFLTKDQENLFTTPDDPAARQEALRRIIGGEADGPLGDISRSIVYLEGSGIFCTGVVVGRRYVLTAAHCLLNNMALSNGKDPGNPSIKVYFECRGGSVSRDGCKSSDVKELFFPPCFFRPSNGAFASFTSIESDIALVKMSADIDFGADAVMRVDGVHAKVPEEYLAQGKEAIAAGYGKQQAEEAMLTPRLMQLSVPIMSDVECSKADIHYASWADRSRRWMCIGGRHATGLCHGDSGGPSMVRVGERVWVVGVNSRTTTLPAGGVCAAPGRFVMSVTTKSFGAWINATMQGEAYQCSTCPCYKTANVPYLNTDNRAASDIIVSSSQLTTPGSTLGYAAVAVGTLLAVAWL